MDDQSTRPVRAAIAHDDPIVAAGFGALLADQRDRVTVVDIAQAGDAVGRVDVLLIDPSREGVAGVDISTLTGEGVAVLGFTWDLGSSATRSAVLAGAC